MARNQTFQGQRPPGYRNPTERAQQGRQSGSEGNWGARDDYFSAMDDDRQQGSPSPYRNEPAQWEEDRYGYPEATSYGREMNRARSGYRPEGRFAQDPWEQRSFRFGEGQAGSWMPEPHRWPQDFARQEGRHLQNPDHWGTRPEGHYPQSGHWAGQASQGGRDAGYGQFSGGYQPDDWRQESRQAQRRTPKGYTRSDERIRDDVCEQLYHSRDVDVGNVSVEVKGGTITLEGSVPERGMKHRIEDICDRCIGVNDVENRIRVERSEAAQGSGSTPADDAERSRGKDAASSARH
ncbi:BON domain-containing protein [Solimonas fluminis]|nr:BON domain-containing protein [Solimonas fluminis]